MEYLKEKQKIWELVTDDGEIIELAPDKSNEKAYYKELQILENYKKLAIRYPGYKTTSKKCDYCVYLVDLNGEHPISHVEIMYDLYNKTTRKNYLSMRKYIEDVARCGKRIDVCSYPGIPFDKGFTFKELTGLMFYIAIQEDINYPDSRYQGRKMCFYRYIEAIYCKVNHNHSIEEAIKKATAKGYIPSNWRDVGDLYNNISLIKR